MNKISVIGLDLAKNVFQVHGVDSEGEVVVRKQLRRSQLRRFFDTWNRVWWAWKPVAVGTTGCGN